MKNKEILVYEDPIEGKSKFCENLILIPLINSKGKPFGLIEIVKVRDFHIDDEYYCILTKLFCIIILNNLIKYDLLKKQLK